MTLLRSTSGSLRAAQGHVLDPAEIAVDMRLAPFSLQRLALVALIAQLPLTVRAADSQAAVAEQSASQSRRGALIRVPLPIAGNVDSRVQTMIQRAIARMPTDGPRPTIVLEFVAGAQGSEFGDGSDFTRALALARFLIRPEVGRVKTVAYVPRSIKGHAVLAVLACEEIVMDPDADLGDAGIDESAQQAVGPVVLSGYKEIAQRHRTVPVAVALGMVDRRLEVLKVDTEVSTEFVLDTDLPELEKQHTIESKKVFARRGELGRFSGREGRELAFVNYLASDREALAAALDLDAAALEEDPSLGGDWIPIRLKLEGAIRPQSVSQLQSTLDDQLRSGEVNFICLQIDSHGGELAETMILANYLAEMDSAAVRTVAYVPEAARGEAALVALACDHLVMHPGATLGGPGEHPLTKEQLEAARTSIRESLAPHASRSWSLPVAILEPELVVHAYRHKKTGAVEYFCAEELAEQPQPDQWIQGEVVVDSDRPLEVTGERAAQLGLAFAAVANFDELKQLYGLEGDPQFVEPSWADVLIRALARPEVAALLLLIGGVAVYAELQLPGIGIGGFVASICFLMFFWSKFLYGTAGWLEVLLFFAGLCCLLLEVFVLPGFGIFGLGGGLLIIGSLVLASQTFILPHNAAEMSQLRTSLLVVGAAGVGMIAAGLMLRRWLPHVPLFNRIMLDPPHDDVQSDLAAREAIVDFHHLLGQTGVTATQLTPSGKANFGDTLVDVIADSEVIDRGTPITVVDVRGNRVLVQSLQRDQP